ncbi:hypothetical protein BDZ94DRAFT_1298489 [Collybia nuda]|uniref:Uncharacterized protein n=1 Tax=Collybia nuda TaxID=64659 RepID=A0A9P5Y4F8_9AGAR|nr:hypothetical protein BDZ94DRAFT_1298489 [Collybia nuda]
MPIEPAKILTYVIIAKTNSGEVGFPFQHWHKKIVTGKDAVRESIEEGTDRGLQDRLIAWKIKKQFKASSLFFRSLYTSKLLPIHLADFRLQIYARLSKWDAVDNNKNATRSEWKIFSIMSIMHDYGGGDIPFIDTNWDIKYTERALEYWVALSKGVWPEEERDKIYL